jgi:hypothetical protein
MKISGTLLAVIALLAGCQGANPAFRGPEVVGPGPTTSPPPSGDAAPAFDSDPVTDVAANSVPDAEPPVDAAADTLEAQLPVDAVADAPFPVVETGLAEAGPPAWDSGADAISVDAVPSGPLVGVVVSTVAVGEPIVVSFSGAAGSATDWVAPAGPSVRDADYDPHTVPGAGVKAGIVVLKDGSQNPVTVWPLAAGKYTVHLFFNDDHHSRAATDFIVDP